MSAAKKSSLNLLCLSLAMACLWGVFAIMDASANPSQAESERVIDHSTKSRLEAVPSGPEIVIDPMSFSVTLPAGNLLTETLTISNQGDATLTFSLYEADFPLRIESTASRPGTTQLFGEGYPGAGATVDTAVRWQLAFLGKARVIIYLHGDPDLSGAYAIPEKASRTTYVYDRLLEASHQSEGLYAWLTAQHTEPRRLLAANAIAANLDAAQLDQVLGFAQVRRVGINGYAYVTQDGPKEVEQTPLGINLPQSIEWNIAKIRADQVWSELGITGEGVVVGVIDTGVKYTHQALVGQYRGNLGSGVFDHNYSWFDFVNGQPSAYDDNGHGTFGMGIAEGSDGGENLIGVAPGAKWIAVKTFNSGGGGTFEDILASLGWMIAPTDLNGANPDPSKAPDVVLNMWGLGGCDHSFDFPIQALRAANILPVFSPGAEGPACGAIVSPASNPDTLAAGATDINDLISDFSGRGPSACYDGSIKPDLSAPGVEIRSSSAQGDDTYAVMSGTSFSAAHLAGAAALLFSADPTLNLDELEQILFDTAVCIENLSCGGTPCPGGANNVYGHGRIDAFEAVLKALYVPVDIPWLRAGPLESIQIDAGASMQIPITFDATGLEPGVYTAGIRILSDDPNLPMVTLPVTLTVGADCQPVGDVSVSFSPDKPLVGEPVSFSATASGTPPILFSWSFDDGTSAMGEDVTHTFASPGTHGIGLRIDNLCPSGLTFELEVMTWQHSWLPLVR